MITRNFRRQKGKPAFASITLKTRTRLRTIDFPFRETNALVQQMLGLLEEAAREALFLPNPLRSMLGSSAGQYRPRQSLQLAHKAQDAYTYAWENAPRPAHKHAPTLIKLVLGSSRGPQDNIFIAIIKVAYGSPQANIWLRVSSVINPRRNTLGPNFWAMKRGL